MKKKLFNTLMWSSGIPIAYLIFPEIPFNALLGIYVIYTTIDVVRIFVSGE